MSNEPELLAALHSVDFLEGIGGEHVERLLEVSQLVEFPEGKLIFREGDPAEHIYFILEGTVSLEICAPGVGCRRILTVSGGDMLGWSPVLEQSQLTATARAMTTVRAIRMNGRQIITLCEYNPRFGYIFMRRAALALAKRLSATRIQLLNVFGNEMPTVPGSL